jgi:DNA-binding response OmpR family regulator
MVSERARGIAAGADAYITKPFVNKELINQVRDAFEISTGVKTEG